MKRIVIGIAALLVVIALVAAGHRSVSVHHRGNQKRTVSNLRSVGTAMESYYIDHKVYPTPEDQTIGALQAYLSPEYIVIMPKLDGWDRPIAVTVSSQSYELRSYGSDGQSDSHLPLGAAVKFDSDIVFSDGRFEQWPEGF